MPESVGRYFSELQSAIIKTGKSLNGAQLKLIPTDSQGRAGTIISSQALDLGRYRAFHVTEEVEVDREGKVTRPSYSFKYEERDPETGAAKYEFRYEKDVAAFVPFSHPICHLHANGKEPRFMTHETNALEVFCFVLANFID